MYLIHRFNMSPNDAWNFSMREFDKLVNIEKEQAVTPIYDKAEQERIISNNKLKKLERG